MLYYKNILFHKCTNVDYLYCLYVVLSLAFIFCFPFRFYPNWCYFRYYIIPVRSCSYADSLIPYYSFPYTFRRHVHSRSFFARVSIRSTVIFIYLSVMFYFRLFSYIYEQSLQSWRSKHVRFQLFSKTHKSTITRWRIWKRDKLNIRTFVFSTFMAKLDLNYFIKNYILIHSYLSF